MKRVHTILIFLILVIAPVFPMVMEPIASSQSGTLLDDVLEELMDIDTLDSIHEEDVELNMMFFTETPSSENGLYYVCRRGVDAIAYFGVSTVMYLSGGTVFTLEFPGSREVIPQGNNPTGSVTNYLLGNDPSEWKTGIADCAVLRYSEIYPGIDLVYKIHDGNLKYEFVVAPYADPGLIQMSYPDAGMLDMHDDYVTISKSGFSFSDTGLWAFQGSEGIVEVACTFQFQDRNTIGFDVGYYEESQELIIDPILAYSTFLGGSGTEVGYDIAVENGYTYITGYTNSADFPTINAYNSTHGGYSDCFVTKVAADGQTLVYSTFLGGSYYDGGYGITVESGFAYVTGTASSVDFPTVNAFNSTYSGNYDCFVTKLATDGQSLVYSTFLGGSGEEYAYSIAVKSGYVYVTGYTDSSDFPTINAFNSIHSGNDDCFVTKLATDGQSLVYSTFLGGISLDIGRSITVESGYAYITGYTGSTDFPTANAYDATHDGGIYDCFVTKLAVDGQSLVYSTFLGGSGTDYGYSIAMESGYAYITGLTYSTDFSTVNAYDSTHDGSSDCFVTKLAVDGQSLVYSTFLGGSGTETGYGIAVESAYAYITGYTGSTNFPTNNSYDSTHNGGIDCFVTKFAVDGQSLVYSTFLGGTSGDYGNCITVESGFVYVTGYTYSSNFPTICAYDSTLDGSYDCFVSVLADIDDSDSDGLSDWHEALYGTDPFCIDTDNDNFLDGYEIICGSDPLDPMSYPTMPQAWYDEIYEDLDGNATLIQYLITWSAGNATLLQTVMQQLDDNVTLLHQVISWLDGNHTAIETLFTYMEGNATLLMQTVNALDGNSSLIENLLTWSTGNATLLQNVIDQVNAIEPADLAQVIAWLDGNHSAIETLFTYMEGNATLLLSVVETVSANSAELDLLAALIAQDIAALNSFNASYIEDMDEIREILDQLGVSVGDADCDGLDDLDEISYGTDLLCIDTDVDNLNDAFEIKIGTDPLNDDSDGDSYLDGIEVIAGTNPLDPLSFPGSVQTVDPNMIIIIGSIGGVAIVLVGILYRKKTWLRMKIGK